MLATDNSIDTSELINSLVSNDIAFAIYKLPQSPKIRLIVSYTGLKPLEEVDFELSLSGFVVAPYSSDYSTPLFIEADFEKEFGISDSEVDISDLKCNLKPISTSQNCDGFKLGGIQEVNDFYGYKKEADEIVTRIRNGEARKVVLSRKKKLGELEESNYFRAFNKLCGTYPDAMVSMVNLNSLDQIWIGASPETLVSQTSDGIFRTMSLAGTQSAFDVNGKKIEPIDALWSHKEIEEQAIVGRYIINCLKKIRVREFEEEGPKTVLAGNLLHLRTFYSIDTREVAFPNLSSVMLKLLHPTPAVCGMPKEQAEKIINDVEAYKREFYSGYLGPINIDSESHIYVNLRTMKIEKNVVWAYVGGGFTEDSQPEKEWKETEIKLDTIKKAFDNF